MTAEQLAEIKPRLAEGLRITLRLSNPLLVREYLARGLSIESIENMLRSRGLSALGDMWDVAGLEVRYREP